MATYDAPPWPEHSLVRVLLLAALGLTLGACSVIGIPDSPLNPLDPKGPFAETDRQPLLAGFLDRRRRVRPGAGSDPGGRVPLPRPQRAQGAAQIHGNTKLEILWTIIPAAILAAIAVPTVRGVFELTECGAGAIQIQIIGHQWWFEYRYPEDDIETANVMVIPAGQEVCASMTSDDVLHNFWIPALNGKRYLVPGQTTFLRLQADEPGKYWGHCAEFCGLSHSLMRARVRAVTEAEFADWLAAQQTAAATPAGRDRLPPGWTFSSTWLHPVPQHRRNQRDRTVRIQRARPDPFHGPGRLRRRLPRSTRPRTSRPGWPTRPSRSPAATCPTSP